MAAGKRQNRIKNLKPKAVKASKAATVRGGGASQSSGAGAGKVTFNPFSITRKVDKASPYLL